MRPVVRDAGHDILCARGWLRLEFCQDLVFKVVVLEVMARQRVHEACQFDHAQIGARYFRVTQHSLVGSLQHGYEILSIVEMAYRPGAMVKAKRDRVEFVRVQADHLHEIPVPVDWSFA